MTPGMLRQRRLANGLGKTGAWFVASRLAQLASGVWITRQLDQQDFVFLAVIFAIQGFAQQLGSLNLSSELVRKNSISNPDLEVAWSYELVRNLIIWSALTGFSPVFAGWMGHPELGGTIRISALGFIITSFRNPRIIELRRKGEFGRLGWIDAFPLLVYALCAAWFVFLSPTFESLVLAGLVSASSGVLLTYWGLPWKPRLRFDFKRARPMIAFGMTLLVGTSLFAVREHGVVFLVSARGYGAELGYLNRATAFSMAFALQFVGIFWKVAYPHYSTVRLQGGDVARDANHASIFLIAFCLPLALLAALFSSHLIHFALGGKWANIAPLWSWFAVAGAFLLANAPMEAALQALRREKIQVAIVAVSTTLHFLISWALLPAHGISAIGIGAVISLMISSLLLHLAMRSTAHLTKPNSNE